METEIPVVTKSDMVAGLRSVGLSRGQHVIVHSSLSRFGRVEGGAETVIAALKEIITPEGTVVMPTFTSRIEFFAEALIARCMAQGRDGFHGTVAELYDTVRQIWLDAGFQIVPFDTPAALWKRFHDEGVFTHWKNWEISPQAFPLPDGEFVHIVKRGQPLPPDQLHPWCIAGTVGVIPETFRKQPDVRRSEHYSGSFAAWGSMTDFILKGHDNYSPRVFEDHPLYRMKELGGKILLLGINHGNNSTIHVAEEAAVRAKGVNVPHEYLGHFMNIEAPLDAAGGQTHGKIGNAEVRLADTRILYRVCAEILDAKLASGELVPLG